MDRELEAQLHTPPLYEEGTVRALLDSDLVTPATRRALQARLAIRPAGPRFLSPKLFATLDAVCSRLVPQDRAEPVDIAGAIDERLAEGKGDGWRYADMPPDGEAYRLALSALDETSSTVHSLPFAALAAAQQDALLRAVQRGNVSGGGWKQVPAARFFEELLAEAVEIYYSHPVAQEEIGYVGMADAHGWQALGLNQLAPHEPRAKSAAGQEPA